MLRPTIARGFLREQRETPGALADGALSKGGEVIGVLPKFMADLEWGHPGLTHLDLVEDMRERKHKLLTGSDAVVALPGGCGTLEELFEAITLKRLGLYFNPILLLDTAAFYQPLQAFLQQVIEQKFLDRRHESSSVGARPSPAAPIEFDGFCSMGAKRKVIESDQRASLPTQDKLKFVGHMNH